MKEIRLSHDAQARLREIAHWTVEQFGRVQARTYRDRLIRRIEALAAGELPHARPCEAILADKRAAKGLCYIREGSHYIILRETPDSLDVVDFIHDRRDLDRIVQQLLADETTNPRHRR